MKPVVILMGLTASGKTQTAIDLAHAIDGEVVSVDSALVYRGMDIGTAKPTLVEQAGIPHHLMDLIDPVDAYSAADFQRDAMCAIEQIQKRGKVPILAGGTMLYFKALLEGLSTMPPADEQLREQLQAELNRDGAATMHARLAACDPVAAARIHLNDPQRLLRALEVYELTGQSLTDWHKANPKTPKLASAHVKLALIPNNRDTHRALVAQRFEQMLAAGFMHEVEQLFKRGDLHANLPAIRSVGYRQAWQYLQGECDYDRMCELAITATRQLAKRQMTWLRKEENVRVYDSLRLSDVKLEIEHYVKTAIQV